MARLTPVTAGIAVAMAFVWAAALVFLESEWPEPAAGLMAAWLVIAGTFITVTLLLAPSRWVQVTTTAVAAICLAVGLAVPTHPLWWIGVALAVATAALVWRPAILDHAAPDRPDRVPATATGLALGLLTMPMVVGAAGWDGVGVGGWTLAGVCLVLGWAYARAYTAGLWAARVGVPLLAVWAIVGMPALAALVVGLGAAIVTALAWTPTAKAGVTSLVPERMKAVSILPELVPSELMESAGFDDKGRPTDQRQSTQRRGT